MLWSGPFDASASVVGGGGNHPFRGPSVKEPV